MKTSVAMTVYNGEQYLKEQLDSILNQKQKPDEVIICDDGSKDRSVEIIREYLVSNKLEDTWKLYQNEKNLGYADNFHKAMELCTGDYIFFSDQDDIWMPDKISSMVRVMENNDRIKLLCSDYEPYYCTEDAPVIGRDVTKRMTGDGSVVPIRLDSYYIYIRSEGCTMCVRKSFLQEIESYWFHGWAHDEYVWKLAMCVEGCYAYHHSTLQRRLHSNNVSKRKMRDLEKRIDYSKNLLASHKQMLEYASAVNADETQKKLIRKNIECIKLRIEMMEKKKIRNIIPLTLFYAKYYYSKKSIPTEFYMTLKG